jgi:hypothetical protein
MFCGGSFVTSKSNPADFDCIVVFATEDQIPDRTERFDIEGTNLDVFFCALDQPNILSSFVGMFSTTREGKPSGVVKVLLRDHRGPTWEATQATDQQTLDLARTLYFNRHVVNRNDPRKALITVHGIRSHGEWNAEIAHIASSNGWIVAPFNYGYVDFSDVIKASKRQGIVDQFRDHIYDIFDRYNCRISVIAHSFGTYVVAKYLLGFDEPPVTLDTLILTGSILSETLDLEQFNGRAFKIINEVAPNDSIVPHARAVGLWQDPLLGSSGQLGFKSQSDILEQRTCDVFTHNNVIRRDVVAKRWLPWLELNIGRGSASPRLLDLMEAKDRRRAESTKNWMDKNA